MAVFAPDQNYPVAEITRFANGRFAPQAALRAVEI
jgi:hypothetical protein